MPDFTPNFLLGHGERLTRQIPAPPRGGATPDPYTLDEAVARLAPMLRRAVDTFDRLPRGACPNDEVVGVMTLHPARMAKSYFPNRLLESEGLRAVGSRSTQLTPEKSTRKGEPETQFTTELYVAGSRTAFRQWATSLVTASARSLPEQLRGIEAFRAPSPHERLKPGLDASPDFFEVVLHASHTEDDNDLLEGFTAYAHSLQAEPLDGRRIFAGGLCFVPVRMPSEVALSLARFSFLRTARPLPRLRSLSPVERTVQVPGFCELPDEDAVDPDVSIAVFDGGVKPSALDKWVTAHEPASIGDPVDEYMDHGHSVTSALLFGSLLPGIPAARPYARVDHYRVLDAEIGHDPLELFDVLLRISEVLSKRQYEFVSLSLGPALPVEDDDVHVWTAKLDEIFANGKTLAGIAVGNTGESYSDWFARVQVPGDSVNSLAIGAADSLTSDWRRAPYSSLGPGRSPGLIKPDVLSFGGCEREPFYVYARDVPMLNQTAGTSFATPSTIRLAAGVRAHFGDHLTPASLKALLINTAAPGTAQLRHETGWGRVAPTLDELVICPESTVRVVYQGKIRPAGWIRAALPLPAGKLEGMVTITASFCFFAAVDPQDPSNYTRAGLEVVFRPNVNKMKPDSTNASTMPFFRTSDFMTEQGQRQVALKWETTLHNRRSFRASTLDGPTFDIHYNARERGAQYRMADELDYGLVISITSPKTPDLYNRVVTTYATQLEIINPVISIPVTIR